MDQSYPSHNAKTKTVEVSNVSLGVFEQDIIEFFSFSEDFEYVEMQSDNERSQIAYVTFKEPQGADTTLLLLGATIVDMSVTITPAPDYDLPPAASAPPTEKKVPSGAESVVQKVGDVLSTMLAKGFILGKDALNKATTFNEKHQLTSTVIALPALLIFQRSCQAATDIDSVALAAILDSTSPHCRTSSHCCNSCRSRSC